ncbi:hypothetical protein Tco_0499649 [Tanacetum coccineum]
MLINSSGSKYEILTCSNDLIESMQNFLENMIHITHNEKASSLLLAEEKSFEDQSQVQETPNQIQKDQEEKSIAELLAEERLQKANQALNESQSPQEIRIQDLEIQKQQYKIYELKDKFNGLSIEIRKIIQEAEELRESEARARIQKIIIDDDDDDLGFYAVHPNTIHTAVSAKRRALGFTHNGRRAYQHYSGNGDD